MFKVIGVGDGVVEYLHCKTMYPGGNALNFSVYAKKVGVDAAYLGVLSNDQAALLSRLRWNMNHTNQVLQMFCLHCT